MDIIIEESNFDKARIKIKDNRNKKIVFTSNDDELNRKILEKEKIDILLLKQSGRKDKQKQRNSGLNSVIAKIAKKKNVVIGILLDEIINSKDKEKSKIISRVRQNIILCNQNKLKMRYIALDNKNQRDKYDLDSLSIVLGMPTSMIKDL